MKVDMEKWKTLNRLYRITGTQPDISLWSTENANFLYREDLKVFIRVKGINPTIGDNLNGLYFTGTRKRKLKLFNKTIGTHYTRLPCPCSRLKPIQNFRRYYTVNRPPERLDSYNYNFHDIKLQARRLWT